MMQGGLSSLALIQIHNLAEVNLDVLVDIFAKENARRMGLGTVLKYSSSTKDGQLNG